MKYEGGGKNPTLYIFLPFFRYSTGESGMIPAFIFCKILKILISRFTISLFVNNF